MSEQEFKRALGYANSAIDLLRRATIPPYPQFYELLYTYATGVNPNLNARINEIFREGDPTVDLAERLDGSGDGVVSRAEFVVYIPDRLRRADRNGDESLSLLELRALKRQREAAQN